MEQPTMTQRHPITPTLEPSSGQVQRWLIDDNYPQDPLEQAVITITASRLKNIARHSAQWGADTELEACVEWLGDAPVVWNNNKAMHPGSFLRDARRPKPPSLKEQALKFLSPPSGPVMLSTPEYGLTEAQVEIIRRALEALPDD